MKKLLIAIFALLILSGAALAGTNEFSKGSFFVTPQVGFNSWAIPFGVNAEYGITPNIGIGGTVMVWLWSDTWYSYSMISPSVEGVYHFTQLNLDKIDLFAGAALGFSIFSSSVKVEGFTGTLGSSGIDLGIVLGGRYFFSDKIAVSLRTSGSFIGGWAGFGGAIGVTFKLK
jgi:outer membrane immunogenic protein